MLFSIVLSKIFFFIFTYLFYSTIYLSYSYLISILYNLDMYNS
jgi:hypothetical protein